MDSRTFDMIVCTDNQNGIGRSDSNQLVWKIKEDFQFFKDTTSKTSIPGLKNVMIMGRITADSIGSALPNRINLVVSTKPYLVSGYEQFGSLDTALEHSYNLRKSGQIDRIFIIGGEQIYREAVQKHRLRYLHNLYVTKIDHNFRCDKIFPFDTSIMSLNRTSTQECIDTISNTLVKVTFCNYINDRLMIDNNEHRGEEQYIDLLQKIMIRGHKRKTRNAVTYSIFGTSLTFDLSDGFPLLTTKKVFMRAIFEELKFFLLGQTDSKILEAKGVNIWKPNTDREFLDSVGLSHYKVGDMGAMYGFQLLHFNAPYKGCDANYNGQGINQLKYAYDLIKNDPASRRIIMTTYNPAQVMEGVLFPCHGICIQFYVEDDNRLSCSMTQRSVDTFLGLAFNISSYALLIYVYCTLLNNDSTYTGPKFKPGRLIMFLNDVHLYEQHIEQAKLQASRTPYQFPTLAIKGTPAKIENINWEDIEMKNYISHPTIKGEMVA
jgi:thymidylate synthase